MDSHEVTVPDSFHTGSMSDLESVREDIKVIKGSCNNCLDLEPEIIFHLGIPSSSPMYKKNPFLAGEAINGMVAVLELAREKGARKVVFASSSSLYNGVPTPHREDAVIPVKDYYTEPLLAIERMAELYYQLYGLDYACGFQCRNGQSIQHQLCSRLDKFQAGNRSEAGLQGESY